MSRQSQSLPIRGLNHISRVCKDVEATSAFYRDFLGFVDIRRPRFGFMGAWLYNPNCAVGVHLIQGEPAERPAAINPKDDHLSFIANLVEVEELLNKHDVPYVKQSVIEEEGIRVTQVFFKDPDHNMIEICNCDEFPVELLQPLQTSSAAACASCPPAWGAVQASVSCYDDMPRLPCMEMSANHGMEQGISCAQSTLTLGQTIFSTSVC